MVIRMKNQRWIVIPIIIINIFIIGICVFLLMRQDRTAPDFGFQTSDYTYLRSDGEKLLLQDIIAYDNRDGDITDRIVIEKITENPDSNTVVVYYAVSDKAGNVAKVSRIFPMESSDEVPEYIAEQQKTEEDGTNNGKEETDAEQGDETSDEDGEEPDVDDESEDDEQPEDIEEEEERGQEDEVNREDRAEEAEPEPVKPVVDKSSHPVLTLKKKEVIVEAGNTPPWTELIETLRDDKDDYTTLYYNLHISKFTSGKVGDYPVTLQAEDSDGYLSDSATITVHVR